MVYMDMRQHNIIDLLRLCACFGQRLEQSIDGDGRSGIDNGPLPAYNKITGYELAIAGYRRLQVKQFQVRRYVGYSDRSTPPRL